MAASWISRLRSETAATLNHLSAMSRLAGALPVLKSAPQAFVLAPENHIVVIDLDSARRLNPVSLIDESRENRLLKMAKLGIHPNPVLDVAL